MTSATENAREAGVLSRLLRGNAVLFALIVVHAAAAFATGYLLGKPFEPSMIQRLGTLFTVMVPIFLLVLIARHFLVLAVWERPERPIQRFLADTSGVVTDVDRMVLGLTILFMNILFFGAFTYFKAAIPMLHAFQWDEAFAAMDRALHFGVDPYVIVHAVLGTPAITTALNFAYHAWLFLMYFVMFVACFVRHDRIGRNTFLIAWVLTWAVGGNLLAIVFSSAGPVYYGPLGYGDQFLPLRATLEAFHQVSPVWALEVQDALWSGYTEGGALKGISAMPSMHVASSTLLAIYGFRYARWAGWLLTIFAAIIVVGSVHLGWHYAVDSYAGILVAFGAWKAAGWLARWQEARLG